MSKNETDRVATEDANVGSTSQSFLVEEGIAEEVNEITLGRVREWRNSQRNAIQTEDTPLTDDEEAFFSHMPPEFLAELRRRSELAKSSSGIPVHEFRRLVKRERMERKAAALQINTSENPDE
ncbi:hypothetical protein ATY78_15160 [Rhizobium sp. R635]|uniref:hypothetical protein n=1 Tax=Rhizobium sp. R635 TaxID=1764275 RepID=UPI000B530D0B|nr:hypothetical protein [Rhizobium sp. R635]OWV91405.1 hypothetical protein ATY78_15160 [Rhizobium sp. R635]